MAEEERPKEQDLPKKQRDRNRFLNGVIVGILLAFLCMLAAIYLPRLVRSLSGRGNPGAAVLTSSNTRTKLDEVQQIIEEYYLGEVDGQVLQDYLFLGVAAGLGDDYAAYYTQEELSDVIDSTRGEYYGIGATIGYEQDTGTFYIDLIYEDSPAREGGLMENDIIRAVDGKPVDDMALSDLIALIRSEDTFTMTVYRESIMQDLDLTLTCGDIQPDYVTYEMRQNGIAYLKLKEFTERAADQFLEALKDLNTQGMTALIVDLRDNPGGLLDSVCDILDAFLSDRLIVYTEDKNGSRVDYTSEEGQEVTCPVAVLVNGSSASAAEIFAGAVQDYSLGPVIGTQTYGKGVVQKTYSLSDGSAFKLTAENYYTPDGQEINGNGITPDLVVEEDPEEAENGEDAVLETALQEMAAWTDASEGGTK